MPYYTVTEEEIKANVFFDALKLNNKAIIQYTWDDRHFWRTTSGWGAAHLAALRVLVFPDLPMDRIIPAEFQVAQDPSLSRTSKSISAYPWTKSRLDAMIVWTMRVPSTASSLPWFESGSLPHPRIRWST